MSKFVTYVIKMPDDAGAKSAILDGVEALVVANGGQITGRSTEDEMTLSEKFEELLEDWQIRDARADAAAIAEAN